MTKAPTPTEMSKGQLTTQTTPQKKFHYTAVADRLRTASWSNYDHPIVVVNRFTGPTFPIPAIIYNFKKVSKPYLGS